MLIHEQENRGGYLSDEVYANPEHITIASRRLTGPNIYEHTIVTSDGSVVLIDEEGYKRIVAWMEQTQSTEPGKKEQQ